MRFLIVFLLFISLNAKDLKVATYNVQNLFDLVKNGNEYKEYIPNSQSGWTEKVFLTKVHNIAKVIKDIDADIIALEEVENLNAARILNRALEDKSYPYIYTFFKKGSSVGSVVFSRYQISNKYSLHVKDFYRDIGVIKLFFDHQKLTLYVNHWPSFKNGFEARAKFAVAIRKDLKPDEESIILGDLNAPYKVRKDDWGKSITQLLQAGKFEDDLYNLWYEVPPNKRYTYVYGRIRNALDHIIVTKNMFDNKKIEYKPKSFGVFKPKYLVDKYGFPKRWEISKKGKHIGKGYSDHLPVYAVFQTKPYDKRKLEKVVDIRYLKKMINDLLPVVLKRVEVLRVDKYSVLIGDGSDKIKIYLHDYKFEKGKKYDILVKEIGKYKRSVEIKLCRILRYYGD